jgi:hypothetical protein
MKTSFKHWIDESRAQMGDLARARDLGVVRREMVIEALGMDYSESLQNEKKTVLKMK